MQILDAARAKNPIIQNVCINIGLAPNKPFFSFFYNGSKTFSEHGINEALAQIKIPADGMAARLAELDAEESKLRAELAALQNQTQP